MYRASIERARALRTWKAHIDWVHDGSLDTGCLCDRQVNRFRKGQKRGGCGHARCYMCHGDKLMKVLTIPNRRKLDSAKDSLLDYDLMQLDALTDLDFYELM
jgi:hypothetical protein